MRKTTAVFLSVLLLLAPLSVLAQTYYSEEIGVSFEVPAGFSVQEVMDAENLRYGLLVSANDGSVHYIVAAAVLAEMEGVTIKNVTEANILFLGNFLLEGVPFTYELDEEEDEYLILYFESEDYTQYVIAEVDDDGFVFTFALFSGTGEEPEEEQFDRFFAFINSIEYEE